MAESKLITAEELIAFVRNAEQPCLPLAQEQLITKILLEIGPTFAALLEQSKEGAEVKHSQTMNDMIPFINVSTEFRNKINHITLELPGGLERAFGVAVMQQVFERFWTKTGDEEEDDHQERRLVIWIDSMLDAYKRSPKRYAKWNL